MRKTSIGLSYYKTAALSLVPCGINEEVDLPTRNNQLLSYHNTPLSVLLLGVSYRNLHTPKLHHFIHPERHSSAASLPE